MEVKYNEKLILKALKQSLANMKIEEITFSKEKIEEIENKVKVKLLERGN